MPCRIRPKTWLWLLSVLDVQAQHAPSKGIQTGSRLARPPRGMRRFSAVFQFAIVLFVVGSVSLTESRAEPTGNDRAAPKSPLSVQQSLDEFRLHPSLKIELVAAEPEVVDPVAIAFDENGRMWVVEMRDYPN